MDDIKKCDLCDNPAIHVHSKCHITAPLRAEYDGDELRLYCYIIDCNRLVASFKVKEAINEI